MTTGDDDVVAPRQVHVSELLAAHGRTVTPSGRRRRRAEPDDVPAAGAPVAEAPGAEPVVAEASAEEAPSREPAVAEVLVAEPAEESAAPVEPAGPSPVALLDLPPVAEDPQPEPGTLPSADTGSAPGPAEPTPTTDAADTPTTDTTDAPATDAPPTPRTPAREWALVGAQLVGALVGGAALWFAFRWLWEGHSVIALVLSAVVIVGLVVVVRVLRKAEDLFSTVLAVLAGLIVTVSPPVLTLTGS